MFHKENPEYNRRQVGFYTLDELVPKDHFLRKVEETIDFSFIYDLVEDSYSSDNGRPSLDPVLLVKIPLIQCFYGIRSMRQTIKDIEVNTATVGFLAYLWTIRYHILQLTVRTIADAFKTRKY